MIGLRPFLLRSAAAIGEGGLDDVAAFWAAVEWNAYLRRGTMLAVCVGDEPMEMLTDAVRVKARERALKVDARAPTHTGARPYASINRGEFHIPPGTERMGIYNAGTGMLTVFPPATETITLPRRRPHAPPPADSWE